MTLTDARPVQGRRLPTPARPARRWRRRVAALVALLVVLAAVVVLRHDPLVHGPGTYAFGRDRPGSGPLPDATLTNVYGSEFQVVDPRAGSRLSVLFGLVNAGPVDVEVLDVGSPLPTGVYEDLGPVASTGVGGLGEPYPPMEPFVLAAGDGRDVGVVIGLRGCPGGPAERGAGSVVVDRVPVTWRAAGRTRTSQVELQFRGTVQGAPQCVR